MAKLQTFKVTVTTAGEEGAAVGDGYSALPINGEIRALYVDWHASAPATSDIDIVVEAEANHPEIVLYGKDNSVADAWVYPKVATTDTAGAAITGEYQFIVAQGRVKVSIADCDALDIAATVYLYVWG